MKLPRLRMPHGIDWSLFILPFLLSCLGIAVIFSITYGTSNNLAYDQILYFIVGLFLAILLSFFDYRTLKGLYLILYVIGIIFLVLVIIFGSATFGAKRWIDLYFFQLQPSELFKIILIIFLARFFSDWQEINWKKILFILATVLVPTFLIMQQPDLGTASTLFIALLAILFLSPIKKIYLIISLAVLMALSPLAWHFLRPYQKDRIEAFINPAKDPRGAGYNVNQAKIAVGSGGMWGLGLGQGSQSRLNFLPVAHTDFIFAGIAEALGFMGSFFLIGLIIALVIRIYIIAGMAKDYFGMYLAGGIGTVFLFQSLVNIGMNMGIMPVTGIPLPFVSYGGSSTLVNFAALGILQSIYLRHKKIAF